MQVPTDPTSMEEDLLLDDFDQGQNETSLSASTSAHDTTSTGVFLDEGCLGLSKLCCSPDTLSEVCYGRERERERYRNWIVFVARIFS